jgi:hypothetical protein
MKLEGFTGRPTLDELAIRHGTDKSSQLNAFTEKYAPYLEPRRDEDLTLLEIGIHRGASLRMWHDYFPRALVIGLDIVAAAPSLEDLAPAVRTARADQSDPAQLRQLGEALLAERGGLDLVIDDGSHLCSHQIVSFKSLFPFVKPGGIYFVEDVTTSYRPEPYGGGLGRPDTFLRFAQDLVPFIPMSMGCAPARERWELDLDFVHVYGYGGLVAVGKLTAGRKAKIGGHGPA